MSLPVFALVMLAALLHATWNAVVKAASDTLLTTVLVAVFAGAISLVTVPFLPAVAPAAWPFLAVSGGLEVIYYALIAAAYRHADMSRAYPLMRGTPPLLVAIVSAAFLGVPLSAAAWAGIVLISAGIMSLIFATRGSGDSRGMRFAAVNILIIASYTLVDGFGVRASGAPITYTMWLFVLTGAPIAAWTLLRRWPILAYARRNWGFGLAGAAGTLLSYGLVLWAMTQAPIPMVAALRETAILFATAIAVLVLKEKITPARLGAIAVIAAGAIVLRLA